MTPLGLALGIYPASVRARGVPAQRQDISTVLFGLRVGTAPRRRRVALSGADAAHAGAVLTGLGIPHGGAARPAPAPAWTLDEVPAIGLCHLRLTERGEDLDDLLPRCAEARVLWADVPAEHPQADELAASLRERGLGLAAYVPLAAPRGRDALRLQRWQGEGALDPSEVQVLPELAALRDEVVHQCAGVRV
jgi:hypothetical protein